MKNKNINLLELFSGIGGFTKGFKEAGYNIEDHYFAEIDKHAIANYKYNFPDAKHLKSVTDVHGRDLPNIDVITFGSPCQDFSLAGKQLGMEGQRSVLILEAIRIIRECRPSIFIWENVKGVFSSNDGADFWAVLAAFTNIGGYRLEWQLLNTAWFLPQNRERIYLIGHLANRSECGVFPITESDGRINERATKTTNVRCLTAGGKSGGHHSSMTLIKQINESKESGRKHSYQQNRVYDTKGIVPTLMKEKADLIVKVAHVSRTDEAKEIRRESMKNGKDYTPFQGKKLEFKESDVMNTITCATQKDNLIQTNNIRRLTEIECERFQGFPDDWTRYGNYEGVIKEVPKTQRYKMCGNAVTVDVVKCIALRIRAL